MPRIRRGVQHAPVRALNRRVYVGNLPYATTETALQQLFATAGNVRSVEIVRHRETRYPRGFGFVEMATPDDALTAIRRLNACLFYGRTLEVNAASDRLRGFPFGM